MCVYAVQCVSVCGCLSGSDRQSAAFKASAGGQRWSGSEPRGPLQGREQAGPGGREGGHVFNQSRSSCGQCHKDRSKHPIMVDKDTHVNINLQGHVPVLQPIKLFLKQDPFVVGSLWRNFGDFFTSIRGQTEQLLIIRSRLQLNRLVPPGQANSVHTANKAVSFSMLVSHDDIRHPLHPCLTCANANSSYHGWKQQHHICSVN